MKKLSFFVLAFMLFQCLKVYGQDPAFTQAYLNQVYLNPAFTGANDGLRVHSSFRKQYNGVPGGYSTQNLAVDLAEPCYNVGLGVIGINDNEGEGFLHTTKIGLTGAWSTTLIKRKLDMSAGGGIGLSQKNIDWDKLTYSNQYDPVLGKIRQNSGINAPATPIASFVDIDFGMMAKYLTRIDYFHDALFNAGFSVHHINRPKEAFLGNARMPALFTFHAGAMITYGSDWKKNGNFIFPYVIYTQQDFSAKTYGKQSEVLVGCYGFKNPLFFGLTYHNGRAPLLGKNTNELGTLIGYQLPFRNSSKAFQIVYSYEFAITGLSFSTLGTHEITLLIYFDDLSLFCRGKSLREGASKCFRDRRSGFIPQI